MKRGIVYVPLGSPTDDFYGADRHGDNLYGNSLVALDAATGKLKWYQQLVHHDLWDFDPAAAPILFDATRNGRTIPAVAQITKMGILFAFDRVTGKPLYGMEERPVPQSTVPGRENCSHAALPAEAASTLASGVHERRNLQPDTGACRVLSRSFRKQSNEIGQLYTPLGLEGQCADVPEHAGWRRMGRHIERSLARLPVYQREQSRAMGSHGEEDRSRDGTGTYVRTSAYGTYARFWNRDTRIPCTNPPVRRASGRRYTNRRYRMAHAAGNHPRPRSAGVKNTGAPNLGGSIATAGGLVFIAATNDSRFRAFESKTGRLVWEQPIDANGHTIPITYLGKDGKQYVVIMAGGGGGYFGGTPSDSVMAFALGKDVAPQPLPPQPIRAAAQRKPAKLAGPVVLPNGPGKALVQRTCGGACHGMDTVTGMRRDRAAWTAMVENMVARGAKAKETDMKAIVDYLVAHFGK